jgi:hypothetical protein
MKPIISTGKLRRVNEPDSIRRVRQHSVVFAPEAFTSDAHWYDLRPRLFPMPERYLWPSEWSSFLAPPAITPWDQLKECGEIGFRLSLRYSQRCLRRNPNSSGPTVRPSPTKVPLYLPYDSCYSFRPQQMLSEIFDRYPHLDDLLPRLLTHRALAVFEGEYDMFRKTESWALVIRTNELIEASLSEAMSSPSNARNLRFDLQGDGFGQSRLQRE